MIWEIFCVLLILFVLIDLFHCEFHWKIHFSWNHLAKITWTKITWTKISLGLNTHLDKRLLGLKSLGQNATWTKVTWTKITWTKINWTKIAEPNWKHTYIWKIILLKDNLWQNRAKVCYMMLGKDWMTLFTLIWKGQGTLMVSLGLKWD